MTNDLENLLLGLLDSMVEEDMPEAWQNAKFIKQRMLQIDKRGSVGERFFLNVLTRLYPRRIEYRDGDQGDWDLKIGRMKFEIKTSSLDKAGKFQNEGLKKQGDYDGILFLGIAPNDIYVYFIKMANIDFDNNLINHNGNIIHLHNRGKDGTNSNATGAGYKCDFKKDQMISVSSLSDLKNEFEREFGEEIR
jgi:hypothetical protein